MACLIVATTWPVATAAAMVAEGSPAMPASFGKPVKPWFGCPKIAGVYAWPPIEGSLAPVPGPVQRGQFANIAGLQLYTKAYLWLEQPDDRRHLRLRAIAVPNDDKRLRIGNPDRGWKQRTLANSQNACSGGWLVITEVDFSHPSANAWYGGEVLSGMRLMALADGGLAIGQWLRVTNRRSVIAWGEAQLGSLPAEDLVYWHWVKLRRVADSGDAIKVDYGN
ncbi:MAG: hypothetical protein ABI593_02620 [Betaproteobacteria bacterium]